jgi:plastocyanin
MRVVTIFSLALFVLNTCNKETNPGRNEVIIEGKAFNPETLIVPVNTTVTWRNRDGIDHTVTSDEDLFDSDNIKDNGTFSTNFKFPGTFKYHCSIHPKMEGVVVVRSLADTVPPTVY